jgi:hypothetical protein
MGPVDMKQALAVGVMTGFVCIGVVVRRYPSLKTIWLNGPVNVS